MNVFGFEGIAQCLLELHTKQDLEHRYFAGAIGADLKLNVLEYFLATVLGCDVI